MIKAETKQASKNRCTRFVKSVDERPKELHGFINNLPKNIITHRIQGCSNQII